VGAVALGLAVELDLGSGGATPLWPRGTAGGAFVAVLFPILPWSWLMAHNSAFSVNWLVGWWAWTWFWPRLALAFGLVCLPFGARIVFLCS